ncbi:MAG: hypothetical protein HY820_34320 [Acidobacteria bacterium]|nr:hypothetical protein [Acidobacteriota bacterium]
MRPHLMFCAAWFAVCVVAAHAGKIEKDTEFRVTLMSPLSTQTSQKGDTLTAQVVSPEEFKGAILEGKVQQSKSGGKITGTSVLNFTFDKLNHNGEATIVQANVREIVNSQGKRNVDEEGRVLTKKNSFGKLAAGTGIGAAIGAIAGGATGAAIGAGIGAAAAIVFVEVGTKGANIDFAPGTEFVLAVRSRK